MASRWSTCRGRCACSRRARSSTKGSWSCPVGPGSDSGSTRGRWRGSGSPAKRGPDGRPAERTVVEASLRDRLRVLYPEASGRSLKQWLEDGRVRVNGVVVRRGNVALVPDDRIELARPVAVFPPALQLVHDDQDLIVIDKPAGLLTIATESEREQTAYRLLRDWVQAQGQGRIFVVHRLDRETSGLLVFARTPAAKQALQAQFRARTAQRVYVARVEGRITEEAGELRSRLHEDQTLRVR